MAHRNNTNHAADDKKVRIKVRSLELESETRGNVGYDRKDILISPI